MLRHVPRTLVTSTLKYTMLADVTFQYHSALAKDAFVSRAGGTGATTDALPAISWRRCW